MRGTLLVSCVLLLTAGCAVAPAGDAPTASDVLTTRPNGEPTATFLDADGDPLATVTLEVAATPAARRQGLMGRESLPPSHGMLFVFDRERSLSFWMKDTLLPLDIIFIDAGGRVVNVAHATPQPNASSFALRRYRSASPAKYVIEVERGFANRTGVTADTAVRFSGPPSLLTPDG